MGGRWRLRRLAALTVTVGAAITVMIGVSAAAAVSSPPSGGPQPSGKPQQQAGRSAPVLATPSQPANLARMGAGLGGTAAASTAAIAAAARQATATGRPVTVGALTNETTTVTAEPDHLLTLSEHVLPVQVRRGTGWVPVNTSLARKADGSYSPAAVPGDAVTFSGGGTGPMATISAAGTSLALTWPASLPTPMVSGATATYPNVLPGTDLVLTATSGQSGGFSELLVVHNAVAARNPALARLRLGVSAHGVRLMSDAGGALIAAGAAGYYAAPAPLMWDSSVLASRVAAKLAVSPEASRAVGTAATTAPEQPAPGAHLAAVATASSGNSLSLIPDHAMLTSPSTTFPVIIDPGFQWYTNDGTRMHFDQTQEGCPNAPHYDDKSYWSLGVGYDGWGGCNNVYGHAHADYEVSVPSQIYGAHLLSATMKTQEAFTASCSAYANVTLSWTGTINKNTAWDNDPKDLGDQQTVNVPPNNYKDSAGTMVNCDTTYDTNPSTFIGVDFGVMPAMTMAAAQRWSAFTFRLWEKNDNNKDDWKRFGQNPYLQVVWNDTPDVPTSETATANSDGSGSAGCDTTGTDPRVIGAISGNGPYLGAHFVDDDGDPVIGTIRYWKYPASSPVYSTLPPTPELNNQSDAVPIPQSVYSHLTNGQVIAWDVQASDGMFTSGWSPTCYFAAWPTAPAAPALSAPVPGSDCPGGVITAGCQVTFTITAASNDPATEFVWRLDNYPAHTSPPSSEILPAAGSPPSAKLTIIVPSPGPHNVWVYASDAGASNSGDTNGATGGDTTFVAAGDPGVTCASFAAALAGTCSGPSAPNTMISKSAGQSCAGTTGDGNGGNLDATDLTNAGWASGQHVTVDGATFTLPAFGGCQSDNVLAAKQTIGLPSGSQGSSLVFLAASSWPSAGTTGLTGAKDSGVLFPDATVPGVPAGIAVTGGGCTPAQQNDQNIAGCTPATGTVNYVAGCTQTSYFLTVPDWTYGPGDIAAVILPHRDTSSGQQAQDTKIYAFAVPVDPGCQIQSVTLPDVGAAVNVQLDSGSSPAGYNPPALHILGMAVRNTSTATPLADGTSTAEPSGQSWTGAWAQPVEDGFGRPSGGWGDQTLRIEATAAAGGGTVRIRLSDPGFGSLDNAAPLKIGHATIALAANSGSPVPTATPQNLTFAGSASVTIPKGGDLYSDPLPFTVSAGQNLLVSLYLANASGSVPYLPSHGWTDASYQWVSVSGDATTDTSGTPFPTSSWGVNTSILSGVDVSTAQTPTVSVLGDNLTDVNYNVFATKAISFPISRLTSGLATAEAGSFGVVAGGVSSGQASADSATASGTGGVSAVARLDRDVLTEPGIGTVIIDEGLQDVVHGVGEHSLEDAYSALITELNGFGVNVIIATITACNGYTSTAAGDSCSSAVDGTRTNVNNFIETYKNPFFTPGACFADFDAAVGDGAATESLLTANDTGDHVNLTQAGYTALTPAVFAQGCTLVANTNLLP